MNNGILLALLAYAVYSWSDAAIKALGGGLTVFEIGFFVALVSQHLHRAHHAEGRELASFLAHEAALGGAGARHLRRSRQRPRRYRLHEIPLAEVYALVFLAPLFVTVLSLFVLRSKSDPGAGSQWLRVSSA